MQSPHSVHHSTWVKRSFHPGETVASLRWNGLFTKVRPRMNLVDMWISVILHPRLRTCSADTIFRAIKESSFLCKSATVSISLSTSYYSYPKNISKKRAKGLHNSIYSLIFAPHLRDNASERKEVWVSGWNHQFAKLTYGLPYRGFESPSFRKQEVYQWVSF